MERQRRERERDNGKGLYPKEGSSNGGWGRFNRPVINVSWDDTTA